MYSHKYSIFFFFVQAEDGRRDRNVTGVQTCALPIYRPGAFRLVLGRVQERGARRQDARHDLDITDAAHEGIGGGFEDDSSQRAGRLARQGLRLVGAWIHGRHRRGLLWRRQERHDGIQQGADAERFARGGAEDRDDRPCASNSYALRVSRSTTPLKPTSCPIGAWTETGRGENSLKPSTTLQ